MSSVYECWVRRASDGGSPGSDHRFTKCSTQMDVQHWLMNVMSEGMQLHDHINIVKHDTSEYNIS